MQVTYKMQNIADKITKHQFLKTFRKSAALLCPGQPATKYMPPLIFIKLIDVR
jgi:hypothetical protein